MTGHLRRPAPSGLEAVHAAHHPLLCACLLSLAGPAYPSALPEAPLSPHEVVRADFGLFNPGPHGQTAFIPSRTVPQITDQAYGWIMLIRTDQPRVRWREELTLPSQPQTWGDPEATSRRTISADGRTAATERTVFPDQGIIYHTWSVAPGDPAGPYRLRVWIEDRLAREFEFELRPEAAREPLSEVTQPRTAK